MITFKYNNRIYKVQHLANKLKKLKITEDDIEILPNTNEIEREVKINALPAESWHNPNLFYFFNPKDGSSIISIKRDISDLPLKVEEYEPTTKEYLEEYWNKTRSI